MFATNLFSEINRNFDNDTVTDRVGYPPAQQKAQGWRAQSHLVFNPASGAPKAGDAEMDKRIVRGGKVYTASTG
jgi:hypothetical protein